MRKLILSAVLLAASVAHAQTTTYTAADVAKHATATDCWYILNTNKVYNFTPFLAIHPAGANIMLPYCGKNGDPGFASFGHSSHAVALEATYLIGTLAAAPAPITVSISPANATVKIGATEQFTATVTGSTTGTAWTLNPATLGTLSANGLFTATTAGQGTVTAASQQDPTKSASAVITVSSATPPPPSAITVTVTPSALTLAAGASHQFTATLTNSTQGVNWTASAALGKITSNGMLTAAMVPATGKVTATSVQDPTKSASVQVTLTKATTPPPPTCPPPHHHDDGATPTPGTDD